MGWRAGDDGRIEQGGALVPITWEDLRRFGRWVLDGLALAGDTMRRGGGR